jgi:ketosteroid isomerase-like protein
VDAAAARLWLDRYFAAWVSNDPDDVAALFTDDAVYAVSPFAEPWVGRDEIVRRWTDGRQEDVEHASEVLAVDGDVVLAHWNVRARNGGDPVPHEWDGILLLRFAVDGRCADHREWYATRDLTD